MASYVLDTHALIFALTAPRKLGGGARRALARVEAGHDVAWIPAAVVAEVVILRELGRIAIGMADLQRVIDERPSLRFLPLDLEQLEDFAGLSAIREPFDRLILAATRCIAGKLITKDARIEESKLAQIVWD